MGLRTIAVTSGKGGVGKTTVVANLGVTLAQRGLRVMVLDADLGLGNLDVMLGLNPTYNLQHVLQGEKEIWEVIMEGPGGIQILPASSGVQELAELTPIQRLQLLQRIDCLQHAVDVLLIDTAAGITSNVTYFNVAAQEILVVVCPDPASLTDAYALMKVLHTKYGAGSFRLVVNLARGPQEAERVQRCLGEVADRFLGVRVEYLGYVLQDEAVRRAVRMQRAAQEVFPQSRASRCFRQLAERLCREPALAHSRGNIQFFFRRLLEAGDDLLQG